MAKTKSQKLRQRSKAAASSVAPSTSEAQPSTNRDQSITAQVTDAASTGVSCYVLVINRHNMSTVLIVFKTHSESLNCVLFYTVELQQNSEISLITKVIGIVALTSLKRITAK